MTCGAGVRGCWLMGGRTGKANLTLQVDLDVGAPGNAIQSNGINDVLSNHVHIGSMPGVSGHVDEVIDEIHDVSCVS